MADKNWNKGNYKKQPVSGLKAFGRVYAGWAFSQSFYRKQLYKKLGYKSSEELLKDGSKVTYIFDPFKLSIEFFIALDSAWGLPFIEV